MVFTADPVCWTEAPHTLTMLGRQRRRWQLGLTQTVMKHNDMIFNPRYGMLGMISMPFHAYMEALGCVVEAAGTHLRAVLVPDRRHAALAVPADHARSPSATGRCCRWGRCCSPRLNLHRYPRIRHVMTLMAYAVIEGVGYRQIMAFFRAQGVIRYFTGRTGWEVVVHKGAQAK